MYYISTRCIIVSIAFLLLFPACKGPCRGPKSPMPAGEMTVAQLPVPCVAGLPDEVKKPHVLIFSSTGGGGQTSAALALQSYLSKNYRISIVQIVAEVWGDFDPIKFCSAQALNGEDLYNFFLRNGFTWSGGFWCFVGTWMTSLFETQLANRLEQFLVQNRPDAIISVVPFTNGLIYKVAERLDIPFAVVAVDLDLSTYLHGIYEPVYDKFYFGIPFADKAIRAAVDKVRIPDEAVRVVGFPVRSEFLRMPDRAEVRTIFGFPHDRPVVMVLMGAAGSRSILSYARKLAKMKMPMHIVFCIGRNESLRSYMERITFPSHITVSIFGFTDKIAQLMRASDLLITKSGSVTVCEAFYAQVPILLDYTSSVLTWERMNIEFVRDHGFGDAILSLHRLSWYVQSLLGSPEKMQTIRNTMAQFALPDVECNIQELVHTMVTQNTLIEESAVADSR